MPLAGKNEGTVTNQCAKFKNVLPYGSRGCHRLQWQRKNMKETQWLPTQLFSLLRVIILPNSLPHYLVPVMIVMNCQSMFASHSAKSGRDVEKSNANNHTSICLAWQKCTILVPRRILIRHMQPSPFLFTGEPNLIV